MSAWAARSAVDDYGVDPARIHVTPPGIDVQLWCPPSLPRTQDGPVRLLFVGGQYHRKGGDRLVDWARRTGRRGWELHIVTSVSQGEVQGDVPGVIFHRAENNSRALVDLAHRCHIAVLPTRADCFSLALLEGMATGLPAIATRVGGVAEVVADGETGLLVEPDDDDALAHAIDTLLDAPELRARMGAAARTRVVAQFSLRDIVPRALARMRELAAAR
jgi:glycosyltransferase involved in cell wall biosynthesis